MIESYEHHDQEARERIAKERAGYLKAASFTERASLRLKAIPWKKFIIFGLLGPVLIPVWIVIACSTISFQGLNSRRRTKQIVGSNPGLDKMKEEAVAIRNTTLLDEDESSASSSTNGSPKPPKQHLISAKDTQADLSVTLQDDAEVPIGGADTTAITTTSPRSVQASIADTFDDGDDSNKLNKTSSATDTTTGSDLKAAAKAAHVISHSFPHLKNVRQLRLLPVQIEISRNMNRLKWKKCAIHCATAINAHASIIVRERRFSGKDGISAVQHAVDMFKDDGEDV